MNKLEELKIKLEELNRSISCWINFQSGVANALENKSLNVVNGQVKNEFDEWYEQVCKLIVDSKTNEVNCG